MPSINVVAAIIYKDKKFLIAKRPAGKHKAGYWEFPGGKVEIGEMPKLALFRELKEELNIEVSYCDKFTEIHFDYPEKSVHLQFYLVSEFDGEPKGLEGQRLCWVSRADLSKYKFPEANLPVVAKLQLNPK